MASSNDRSSPGECLRDFRKVMISSHRTSQRGVIASPVEICGQYTTDYDTATPAKRIQTLRNNLVSNTAVLIITYGSFAI